MYMSKNYTVYISVHAYCVSLHVCMGTFYVALGSQGCRRIFNPQHPQSVDLLSVIKGGEKFSIQSIHKAWTSP